MSVTHIAGSVVRIGGRTTIQRCALCGYKLLDSTNTAAPLEPDGSEPVYPTWGEGALVQVDGPHSSLVANDDGDLPADSCWALVRVGADVQYQDVKPEDETDVDEIGRAIQENIIDAALITEIRTPCEHDDEYRRRTDYVVVWTANAAEQLGEVARRAVRQTLARKILRRNPKRRSTDGA